MMKLYLEIPKNDDIWFVNSNKTMMKLGLENPKKTMMNVDLETPKYFNEIRLGNWDIAKYLRRVSKNYIW